MEGTSMQCPNCQFENREGVKFCEECGATFELKCPACKANIPLGRKFCGECGHNLIEPPEETPSINYSEPQSYTPKHLTDKILTTRSSIEGERKLVTVLFADVANYTSMAENLDPEEVHQIMDGCFKILMDEIHSYEGTINQFTGDGVMALFGAPVAHEDHAQRACYAALSIQKAIGEYGDKIEKETGGEFKLRIGLNSGPVIVGAIGNDLRMDYTAVGDTTNLGSRMESKARPGTILVSGNTHRLVRDFFEFEILGKVEVKGKEEPQEAFELIKAGEVETRIGASMAKGLTRFVGRKNSIAVLMDAFDKMKSGSGQVVGLVGEAGVGKSRLLLEMRNTLPQGEHNYLEGRCLHFGGSMAYLPILGILRSYFELKEGDQEFIIKKKMDKRILDLDDKLSGVIPPFQELLSLKVDDEGFIKLEPKEKRDRTFEALRDLMIRGSEEKPLVIAVEDVHWIDKTSEEFIDYVIEWLANTRILLILLYRPEYTHQWGSKSYYSKIGLNQLDTQSSAELVKAILEGGEVAPVLRQLILNRAAGNPLFLEEFTHTLIENGSIERKDEKYVLSRKASDIQVPDTIQGIISARMDRLEDNLKRTMQVASVIGRDFAFRILQTITGMKEEIKSHLLNLQGLEFIYEKSLFPELEYIFKHALTQEVAYNSLLIKRRKEIHEKIGKAIEQIYQDRLEEFYEILAYHYVKSDNAEKAYQYLKLSGEKATRNFANWEAFGFYKESISVLNQLPETEENKKEKLEVLGVIPIPMAILGFPEDSLSILLQAEQLATELGDEKKLATLYSRLGHYYSIKVGDPIAGIQYVERCFTQAEKIQDIGLMGTSACDLCSAYINAGEFINIIDMAPKVIALLEETQRTSDFFGARFNVYSALCAFFGFSLGMIGNFKKGKAFCEKGLCSSSEVNDLYGLGWIEFCYGVIFQCERDGKGMIEHFQNSIDYLEKAQAFMILGHAWVNLGHGYFLIEELETALKLIKKGMKIQKDHKIPVYESAHYCHLAEVYFASGDLSNAHSCMKAALKLSQKNKEKWIQGWSRVLLGRILWKRDPSQNDKAQDFILRGIKILEALNLNPYLAPGYLFIGEFYNNAKQRSKALENLKKAEEMFQEMGIDYWLARTKEVLANL
jgi:class 3 adenylate cyclase/tetratricopeptide (TPR) repeat protein